MVDLIHPSFRGGAGSLREQFLSAQPFRHLVLDSFLEPDFCRRLMEEFPPFDAAQATNELGEQGRKAVRQDLPSLGPAYRQFDDMIRSARFLSWLGEVTAIPDLLYDPDYIGGGTHENLSGQDLDPHVDFNYHPARGLHRRLNLIVFLNPEWREEWGGCLQLHRNPWAGDGQDELRTIVPLANRAVVFETSEHSWHGFRRIELPKDISHLSRRSIAVYFYTKGRPREETAPSHGTVYVPRPLPGYFQPGYTLRPEDVDELAVLLQRRDTQIQYLYQRELEFARIAQSPTYRLARLLAWPARAIKNVLRSSRSSS